MRQGNQVLSRKALAAPELSSQQVARLAGITRRQLDWWCLRGYVRPYRRPAFRFQQHDIVEIMILARLRTLGLAIKPLVRKVLRLANAEGSEALLILIDGQTPAIRKFRKSSSRAEAIVAMNEHHGPVLFLDLADMRDRAERALFPESLGTRVTLS